LAKWQVGKMASWQNGSWQNDKFTKWQVDKMAIQKNGNPIKWLVDEMTS